VQISFEIAFDGGEFLGGAHAFFYFLALGQSFLRFFLVLPEIGRGDAGFQFVQDFLLAGEVKDSSVLARCARGAGRSDAGGLR
jgi:hypothetical protein